jgi:hypothetical protein
LIVMRRPREQDLFEDRSPYRYHAIASNRPSRISSSRMWGGIQSLVGYSNSTNWVLSDDISYSLQYQPAGEGRVIRGQGGRSISKHFYYG